ncbi:MAG: LamG domain-containing protein, partial [Sedimentisphaerales bacterium]
MCRTPSKRTSLLPVLILMLLSSTLYAQDPSLVLYFSFDEEAADQATDHSQYRNNGTIDGNPEVVAGQFGSALMFDAVDDQVVVPTNDTLDIENEITMMLWAKPGPNLTADWRNLVGKAPTNVLGNNTFSYTIRTDNTGILRFSLNLGGWQSVLGPTLVEDTWYHIGGTYDGTQLTLSVDGQSVGTTAASGTINVTTDPLCIGNLVNAAGASQNEFWSGVLDEVRIWDRALSADEVSRNMNQGREDVAEPLTLAWRPDPADGAMLEATWVTLGWSPGDLAVSHDVYLGDKLDDVNDATRDSEVFRGNQTATFYVAGFPGFAYPDGLVPGTTYYWRIDEVNDADPNSSWKGDIWSFWVPPKKAYEPDPADGVEFVDPHATLSWTPGMGALLHTVYIGDNFDELSNATVGSAQTDATFTPDTLEFDTRYYWRVDEFDGVTTERGDVWSFTTKPFVAITDPNLVCWWTLNEGTGTNILDWSGHGHDGVVQGGAEWVPGYDASALHFRAGGSGSVVHSLGSASDWAAGTVALWVKADSLGQAQYSSAFSGHVPNTAGFQIDVDGGNPGQYRINPPGLFFGAVTTGWVHLAM